MIMHEPNDRDIFVRASSQQTPCFAVVETRIGKLRLVGDLTEQRLLLRGIYFEGEPHAALAVPLGAREDVAAFAEVRAQLDAYFDGERTSFDLALAPIGTDFQLRVWTALASIPYGTTTTYEAVACRLGKPRAVRAVGAANGKNPLSIVIPCHRVIGKDGALTGYAGGLVNKRRLLAMECERMARTREDSRYTIFSSGF